MHTYIHIHIHTVVHYLFLIDSPCFASLCIYSSVADYTIYIRIGYSSFEITIDCIENAYSNL